MTTIGNRQAGGGEAPSAALEIGEPIRGMAVWASAYGGDPGKERIYAVSCGAPCMLHVIDPFQAVGEGSFPLEGSDHCWGVVYAPSGVYIGGSGILYRYTRERGVENLGEIIPGETYTWRLAVDRAGNIYGGCYPGGKAFQYDPRTGRFRDYGVIVPGEQYVRSMEAWEDKLYIGMGTQAPHLIELDPVTGDKAELTLPDEVGGEQLVYDLNIVSGKLFARLTPSNRLFVYDLARGEWADRIEGCSGLSVSRPDANGNVYFVKDDRLCRYDPETKSLAFTSLAMPEPAGDYGWLDGHPLNPSGRCLVGVHRDGSYWVYDPEGDRHGTYEPELPGQPVILQSIAAGPEGSMFVGGYFAGGLGKIDAETGRIASSFAGIGQSEGLIAGRGRLYIGVYPKANIFEYDPSRPWRTGENPKMLFSLREEEQDRPFVFAWAGRMLAIGTVPGYGRHGGAVTLYDPESGIVEVYRHLLPEQSVVSLLCRDRLLFAGGSVWGGLGVAPARDEASLLVWDWERRETVWTGVPVPGEKAISGLAADDEGMLWGLTGGLLFKFDPREKRTLATVSLFDAGWPGKTHFWRGGNELLWRDGRLYGVSMNRLFAYDPEADRAEVLDEGVRLLAEDRYGSLYYAKGTVLHRRDAKRGAAPFSAEGL